MLTLWKDDNSAQSLTGIITLIQFFEVFIFPNLSLLGNFRITLSTGCSPFNVLTNFSVDWGVARMATCKQLLYLVF